MKEETIGQTPISFLISPNTTSRNTSSEISMEKSAGQQILKVPVSFPDTQIH